METFIPYQGKSIDVELYLTQILEFHQKNTPYWQKILDKQKIDDLISSNFEETLFNLSKLEVDQNLLRTNWLLFKPLKLKNQKYSFSSATTGPQKYCIWSQDYVNKQGEYISFYLQGKGIKNAIIHGPASVYKDVNEKAINMLGGIPYFVSFREEGLKLIIEKAVGKGPEEMTRILKEYFKPELEKTRRFLEHDENINFMRSAWMMLAFFEDFFGEKRNVENVMTSGLGYTPENHKMLMQKFKNVIISYGYFVFGDALGKYTNGNLDYYPAFPYTMFTVVKEDGEIAKYGEEGNPLFIVARKDLFLVLKEKNEYAKRVPPTENFMWDGIRNPHRTIA
ncbi:MAG: hypothetical protein QXN45_04335 [Candidatus Thermoplasmatota archaeon]